MIRIPLWYTLLACLITFAIAIDDSKHIDVHAWPLSEIKSQLLASIEYNSTAAVIAQQSTRKIPTDETIVRIGFHQSSSNKWNGIATAAANLGPQKEKVILLHLDSEGIVYHVGFKAVDKSAGKKNAVSLPDLRAEVLTMAPAPMLHLNKPVVLDADGQMEKPAEKTFLQKYWWAIAGFLLLQVFLGGGGGSDKKE